MKTSFVLLLIALAPPAFACEGLRFRSVSGLADLDGRSAPAFDFEVSARTDSSGCRYFVTFGPGGALSTSVRRLTNGEREWAYNLYREPGRSRVLRGESEAKSERDVIAGELAKAAGLSTRSFLFHAILSEAPADLPPGEYRDDVTMTLWKGTPPNGDFVEQRVISVRATRLPSVAAEIDPKSRELTVRGNVPAAVTLSSRKKSRRAVIDAKGPVSLDDAAAKAFGKVDGDEITVVIEAKD